MKKILLSILMLGIPAFLFAAEKERTVSTVIESVTVYLKGAEISREASVSLYTGRNILKISSLSSKLNPASVMASVSGTSKIISINHQYNYLAPVKQEQKIKLLLDSIETYSYQLDKIRMDKSALVEEQKILIENRSRLGKGDGVSVTELMAATEFYRTKLNEINSKLLKLKMAEDDLTKDIDRMDKQLAEWNTVTSKAVSEFIVIVEAETNLTVTLTIKYIVNDAAWSPKYDLRTEGVGKKIELDYRAQVLNKTEEDWNNVKLTLSTADLQRSMERPVLEPWGLSYSRSRKGTVIPRTTGGGEGLLGNVQARPGDKNGVVQREVEVSYSEIEVSEMSVDFNIKEKYSIACDGKLYLVDVNEYKLDATYSYFAIPKVNKDAFLMAKVVGWESLNLMEGPVSVYFNGTYIGLSTLDTRYANDTLELSLGTDRKVVINRVKREDKNSKKLLGLNRSETFTYEIDVRNNNNVPITLELLDQVPISQESEISVDVEQISKAQHDLLSGKLTWNVTIPPAQSQKYIISFTVKYPKNREVIIRKSRKVICPKFR